MFKHIKFAIRTAAFMSVLLILIIDTNNLLTPKFFFDEMWPTTTGYKGFYKMENDTINVLFLGSSHAAAGFNPQIFYNSYGIKSYNLGCEQQNLVTSYYWLQEALRFQTPKVAVLDTYMLYEFNRYEPLNTSEVGTRKAIDSMKWGAVKWNAVKDICLHDENQTINSYLFPNLRYHTRWNSLEENDFVYKKMEEHYELKGYTPLNDKDNNQDYEPFETGQDVSRAEMVPLMKEYLDKIVDLCKKNQITLILVKTPTTKGNIAKYNSLCDYAIENEIAYWDFNKKETYEEAGFVFADDMNDIGHCNIWGAEKISSYMASRLYNEYDVLDGEGCEQWEETKEYYHRIYDDCCLKYITDIDQYIDAVSQDRYTVLMAVKGDGTRFMQPEIKDHFKQLGNGLQMEIEENGSYYAAIAEGIVNEKARMEKLEFHGSTRGMLVDFEILSGGWDIAGNICSIKINNVEQSTVRNGLNIVVYSNETYKVVDSICYNGNISR